MSNLRFTTIGDTVLDNLDDEAWEASGATWTSYKAESPEAALLLAAVFNAANEDDFVSVFDCVDGNCHVCQDGLKGLND